MKRQQRIFYFSLHFKWPSRLEKRQQKRISWRPEIMAQYNPTRIGQKWNQKRMKEIQINKSLFRYVAMGPTPVKNICFFLFQLAMKCYAVAINGSVATLWSDDDDDDEGAIHTNRHTHSHTPTDRQQSIKWPCTPHYRSRHSFIHIYTINYRFSHETQSI